MKRLFVLLMLTASVALSCTKFDDSLIWDKLNNHEDRISELERQCRQMNTNIEALQTILEALQNNEYVTSVTPIVEDGVEIGYTITFSSGKYITVYHGKNGQDGEDYQDGVTPIIGVAQDTDGIYYWTVNGSWLLDADGNKVKAVGTDGQDGQDGQDGAPGQDGSDGADGVTPQLKIENGLWYVSYDDGSTWLEIGQATGDQGPQGPQGDSFFQSIIEDEEYVYMILANGAEIVIPKKPLSAAILTLGNVTDSMASFDGIVNQSAPDLKVAVYYSRTDKPTIYKHLGSVSMVEFDSYTFKLTINDLFPDTTYYYFTEVICDGVITYGKVSSFRTAMNEAYVGWEDGENIGGEI